MAKTFYQLQRSTPGHKAFRDSGDPWRKPDTAAHYAVQAVRYGTPGLVVRILPFEV